MSVLKKTSKFQVFELASNHVKSSSNSNDEKSSNKRMEISIGGGKRITYSDILKISFGKAIVVLDESSLSKEGHKGIHLPYKPPADIIRTISSYPRQYLRCALLIKLISLMHGKSGVSRDIIHHIAIMLNDDHIPQFTSDNHAGQELVNAISMMEEVSMTQVEANELIHSRFFLTGVAALLTAASQNISLIIDPIAALSAEYCCSDMDCYDSNVYETNRPHRGQITAASNIRLLLDGSKRMRSLSSIPLSNAANLHAFHIIPQVNGSIQDVMMIVSKSMEIELNSVEEASIAYEPIPATIAIRSIMAMLELIISSSYDRLNAIRSSNSDNHHHDMKKVSSSGDDITADAIQLLDNAWTSLSTELTTAMQQFNTIESSSASSNPTTSANDPDEDEDDHQPSSSTKKTSKKPEQDDSKLTPQQLAKTEAKRKAKADKAAMKAAAKEAKKQPTNAIALGSGTSSILAYVRSCLRDNDHNVIMKCINELLNPYHPYDDVIVDQDNQKHLGGYAKKLLEQLASGNMNKRKPKIAKGARDFTPDQMRIREQVFNIIRTVFKRHGGVEIDTPVFELKEILTGKYGEDSKLIYDLADQGGELLSLRYDLTVPFARFLAMNSVGNIKRYHIAKVYRRDQPQAQRGRYREFYQCDFDIAGSYAPMIPDAEAITVATEILSSLPAIGSFMVKLNHRKILDAVFELTGVPSDKFRTICSAVDKLDKMSWEEVKLEMIEKGITSAIADDIGTFVLRSSSSYADPRILVQEFLDQHIFRHHEAAYHALSELILLFNYLEAMGSLPYICFDLSLARGLDYYTGVIYEIVLLDGTSQVGSISAGGRYDQLVGMFSSSGSHTPCVGISIGVERIFAIMERKASESKLLEASCIQVYVASIGDELLTHRMSIARVLWQMNIATEFSYQPNPKFKKQLDEVLERGIPFMVVLGEEEVQRKIVKVKNMMTKTEIEVDVSDLNSSSPSSSALVSYLLAQGCKCLSMTSELVIS